MNRILTFIFFIILIPGTINCVAQVAKDSAAIEPDSLLADSFIPPPISHKHNFDSLLKNNKFFNLTSTPVSLAAQEKTRPGKEFLFYLIAVLILLLGLCKVFYTKYFNNIFRVFFNTSLRQNQLTDLLLQAKLPSLIFNIFFIITTGLYTWLLLNHYHLIKQNSNYLLISFAILAVGIIYFGKFLSLKLIGWISGMEPATDQYIFVIFLINKIIGIILIPFIILLAFAPANWLTYIIISSFCIIGILFMLRYLRSYGLLQNQLRINIFHFALYIIGVEVLPILIIYKLASEILL